MYQALVDELRRLERPISQDTRETLLADLRSYPTDLDSRRPVTIQWKRGNVYFHALQDLGGATYDHNNHDKKWIKPSQACFVKDLDLYLSVYPSDEPREIRSIFEVIFSVGTSAYWTEDRKLVTELCRLYQALDKEVIRPWAEGQIEVP